MPQKEAYTNVRERGDVFVSSRAKTKTPSEYSKKRFELSQLHKSALGILAIAFVSISLAIGIAHEHATDLHQDRDRKDCDTAFSGEALLFCHFKAEVDDYIRIEKNGGIQAVLHMNYRATIPEDAQAGTFSNIPPIDLANPTLSTPQLEKVSEDLAVLEKHAGETCAIIMSLEPTLADNNTIIYDISQGNYEPHVTSSASKLIESRYIDMIVAAPSPLKYKWFEFQTGDLYEANKNGLTEIVQDQSDIIGTIPVPPANRITVLNTMLQALPEYHQKIVLDTIAKGS